jgi:hypothetical protein
VGSRLSYRIPAHILFVRFVHQAVWRKTAGLAVVTFSAGDDRRCWRAHARLQHCQLLVTLSERQWNNLSLQEYDGSAWVGGSLPETGEGLGEMLLSLSADGSDRLSAVRATIGLGRSLPISGLAVKPTATQIGETVSVVRTGTL